jgi:hypothetical protein
MTRRPSPTECTYCGGRGPFTRDHIPPSNLFPKPRPNDLITVPACGTCNHDASLDDEYFRLAITTGVDPARFPREFAHSLAAIRRLAQPRKVRFAGTMIAAVGSAQIHSPAGVYLGRAPALQVQGARVLRVVARIIAGLYYHHLGVRLPAAHERETVYLPRPSSPAVRNLLAPLRTSIALAIARGVLTYRYAVADDRSSIWHLTFFGHRHFLGFNFERGGA